MGVDQSLPSPAKRFSSRQKKPRFSSGKITDFPQQTTFRDLFEDINMPERDSSRVPDSIRIKNRRKIYLDTHPEYFGPSLELAGPRLQTRYQTHLQQLTTANRSSALRPPNQTLPNTGRARGRRQGKRLLGHPGG
jgi:hypothetical protein